MFKKNCPKCLNLIGAETRAKIIQQLKKKQSTVSEIGKNFNLTQPTISYHLKALEKTKIVFKEKQGREIFYSLNKKYPCKNCYIFKILFKI